MEGYALKNRDERFENSKIFSFRASSPIYFAIEGDWKKRLCFFKR